MNDWRKDPKARRRLRYTWYNMIWRCENPNDKNFHRYGGRGISVCEEWHNYPTFIEWAYESGYDPYAKYMECTLDRIDNDGNYEPSNCQWISMKEQTKHTCRSHRLTYLGETHTLIEWVEITGMPASTIYKRAELGMPPKKVLAPYNLASKKPIKGTEKWTHRVEIAKTDT